MCASFIGYIKIFIFLPKSHFRKKQNHSFAKLTKVVIKHPQLRKMLYFTWCKEITELLHSSELSPHIIWYNLIIKWFLQLKLLQRKNNNLQYLTEMHKHFSSPPLLPSLRTPLLPHHSLGDQGSSENVAQKGKIKEKLSWYTGQETQWVPFISNHWIISWSSQEIQIKDITEQPRCSSGDLLAPAVPYHAHACVGTNHGLGMALSQKKKSTFTVIW